MPEYLYVANQFSSLSNPLLPIGIEYHPSRYSPVHSFFLALWTNIFPFTESFSFYSPVVIIFAMLMLYKTLELLNANHYYRVGLIGVILLSPITINISRSVMSESTMLLLFCGALYFVVKGLLSVADKSYLFLYISGFLLGLLVWCRITFAVLAMILVGVVFCYLVSRGKPFSRSVLAISAGGASVLLLGCFYAFLLTGKLSFSTYSHWLGVYDLFGLQFPYLFYTDSAEYNRIWKIVLATNFGFIPYSVYYQPYYIIIFLSLYVMVRLTWIHSRKKTHTFDDLAIFRHILAGSLYLYFLSHIVLFLFYEQPLPRFSIISSICLFVSFVLSLGEFPIGYKISSHPWKSISFTLFLCVVISPVSFWGWIGTGFQRYMVSSHQEELARIYSEKNTHRIMGSLIEENQHPVFVDGLGSLQARLLFELDDDSLPIFNLSDRISNQDPHHFQFYWYSVERPIRINEKYCLIAGFKPSSSTLIRDLDNSINTIYVKTFSSISPRFFIYYNTNDPSHFQAALDYLQHRNATIEVINQSGSWELVFVNQSAPN